MTPLRGLRARPVLALVTCATLALSGCGGLPTSTTVQAGLRVDKQVDQRARVVVSAPIKGATQDVIARDFIRSGASFQETDENQQAVGRAYLAPTSVDRWQPTSSVTVYDAAVGLAIDQLPADQLRLTVTAVASIDTTGHYTELPPGTTRSLVLSMVRADGEWRIDLPREGFGLWLNTDDFDRVYAAYDINYVVAGTQRLVSDLRWFPAGSRVATSLARAQLGPVPAYLDGVGDTAVPPTAQLAVDAVEVDPDSGRATVVLTDSAPTLEPERRRAMWAQFVATLLQIPAIASVRLQVASIGDIPVPNLPPEITSLTTLGYTQAPTPALTVGAVRRGDSVLALDPQSVDDPAAAPAGAPLPGAPGPTRVSSDYTGLALSADGTDLAAVARSRRELVRWRDGVPHTAPSLGIDLTDPAYDTAGRLWVAGVAGGVARVWTLPATTAAVGAAAVVRVDWLGGRRVVALRVSPDDTRAAVISSKADGSDRRLDLAGIQRDGRGLPLALADPYRQGQPLLDLASVVWLSPDDVAVLAREKRGAPLRPFDVQIGGGVGLRRYGKVTLVPPVPAGVRLTTRGGVAGLVMQTGPLAADGTGVQLRVGGRWQPLVGVSDLVVGGL